MSALHRFARKLACLIRRARREDDMQEEFRFHLAQRAERERAAGLSPNDAHLSALKQFGGVEQIKERVREERTWAWIEDLARDLRMSLRSLRRAPGFSAAVILTLALCIGANTAVVSALYGLILKPLPYHDSGQIVEVLNSQPKLGINRQPVSLPQYLDYRAHADLFDSVALLKGWMFNTDDAAQSERLVGIKVTPEYFQVLGLQPLLGRFFAPEESVPGKDAVVVLGQAYWESHYKADPAIVGKVVRLSRRPYTVVGVAPRSADAISVAPNLMVPLAWGPIMAAPEQRLAYLYQSYARIKPGVSRGAAQAQLQALEQGFIDRGATPAARENLLRGGSEVKVESVRSGQMAAIRDGLVLLQCAALLVLLLGCVNVSSLLLARANARQGELAVRQALGASPGALARQLFSEAAWLATAGAALGLILAWGGLRVINLYTAKIVYGSPPVTLDGAVLGMTCVGAFVVALLIGLVPVLRAWRLHGLQANWGSRGASRDGGIRRASGFLVVAQVALALVLLSGAGLLVRSFAKVIATAPGFDATAIVHVRVAVDWSYRTTPNVAAMQRRLVDKLQAIPGVEAVAYSAGLPGTDEDTITQLPLFGAEPGQGGTYTPAVVQYVSDNFLSTMGIRILEGRNFTPSDILPTSRTVVIVDRRFAEKFFPGRSAVGERFGFGSEGKDPQRAPIIVGVAETARWRGLEDRRGEPYIYRADPLGMYAIDLELKTRRAFGDILPVIRGIVREVDPALPAYNEKTMQMQLDEQSANLRGVMWLLGAFATIAVVLVAVGIYGMLNYDVTQRTREIGIRGAIGATRGQIVAMVLRQGVWKAGLGLVIGLLGSIYLARYVRTLLYGVEPTDPAVLAAVIGLLIAVTLLASWFPARRAAKVDPMVALRAE